MVVCVECLPADKPSWDVVSVTRRSSGVAPRACLCARVRASCAGAAESLHTYMHTIMRIRASRIYSTSTRLNQSILTAGANRVVSAAGRRVHAPQRTHIYVHMWMSCGSCAQHDARARLIWQVGTAQRPGWYIASKYARETKLTPESRRIRRQWQRRRPKVVSVSAATLYDDLLLFARGRGSRVWLGSVVPIFTCHNHNHKYHRWIYRKQINLQKSNH